jgi:phage terminase small subunit
VQQYLVDLKTTEAAIRTGNAANSAHVTASRLLAEPKVQQAITDELCTKFAVNKETIIQTLAAIVL